MFPKSMQISGYDDELWQAIGEEERRQEEHVELIASENYASPRVMQAQGTVLTNKYAEGYPGKRYYGGCEFVDVAEQSGHRARQDPVRRRLRQCPAPLRLPGQRGGLHGPVRAGRHRAGHEPGPRRPPDPRRQAELLRQDLQRVSVRPGPGHRRDRLRPGRGPGQGASAAHDRRRLLRLLPGGRLAALPRHRRRGRRLSAGGHGPRRRPGGGRGSIRARCRSPMSPPPPPTRPCAVPAAA